MQGGGDVRASITILDALYELYANIYGSLDAPNHFVHVPEDQLTQICLNPQTLSFRYSACV